MSNTRTIDLKQVAIDILKRIWLPAVLAGIGVAAAMFATINKASEIPAAEWTLRSVYSIRVPLSQELNAALAYRYEIDLAGTVCQLLNTDAANPTEDNGAQTLYAIQAENRRITVTITGFSESQLKEIDRKIEEQAKSYLAQESNDLAVLTAEKQTIAFSKKESLLLGGLMGACIGFAILLAMEYAKSPKEDQ